MLILSLFVTPVYAAEEAEKPKTEWSASGAWSIWNLQQQNFLLGKDHALNDASYTVQNLRVTAEATRGRVGVSTRFDAAQGWWGADNDPANGYTTTTDADGNVSSTRVWNDDLLFRNKETNYGLHVDIAYGWVNFGPIKIQGGRQYFGVGNKLVLDEDYEGVQGIAPLGDKGRLELGWAKVSEGQDAYRLPAGSLISDGGDGTYAQYNDVDLFSLRGFYKQQKVLELEGFALLWWDRIGEGGDADRSYSHVPNGLTYNRPRFEPNLGTIGAFGVMAKGALEKGFSYNAEADFLIGTDPVDNADHAGGMLDINNGQVMGYNAYAELTQGFSTAKPMDVGLLLGYGSGDPDPTSGRGNINRLDTMGYFPFLNVWEDSVMPDVEGIAPQGLGSPVSRGYREFENTTAAALKFGIKPHKSLRLEAVGAYLRASQPVYAYDATGVPDLGLSSKNLGWEADANAIVNLFNGGFQGKVLFGYFSPGDAAGYLINGNSDTLEPAIEVKTEVIIKF